MTKLGSKFELWPVGQGLFYSGFIRHENEKFRFIYDCGGEPKKIVRMVQKYLHIYGKEIDMLVISHLDSDHINGLPVLFREANRVNRVYIPYYGNLSSYLLLVAYIYGHGGTLSNKVNEIILVKTTESESGEIQLIETGAWGEDLIDPRYVIGNVRTQIGNISSGNIKKLWKFKFYNTNLSKEGAIDGIKNSIDQLINNKGCSNLQELLVNHLADVKKNLRDIYKEYVSTHFRNSTYNQSSLCLYHSPLIGSGNCEVCTLEMNENICSFSRHICCLCSIKNYGTLLTGDISLRGRNTKYVDFLNYFIAEQNETLFFLVPHHGADNNWNPAVLSDFKGVKFYLNSAGISNSYGHPSCKVRSQILDEKCFFLCANENSHVIYNIYASI